MIERFRAGLAMPWRRLHTYACTFEVRLVDNWRRAHHFGSVQISAALGTLSLLCPLLAEHWPEIAPLAVQFCPRLTPNWVMFIGAFLTIVARLITIRRKDPPCQ